MRVEKIFCGLSVTTKVSSFADVHREFCSSELRNVGNYELHHVIGKGSFGKVYLATHRLTNGSKVGYRI